MACATSDTRPSCETIHGTVGSMARRKRFPRNINDERRTGSTQNDKRGEGGTEPDLSKQFSRNDKRTSPKRAELVGASGRSSKKALGRARWGRLDSLTLQRTSRAEIDTTRHSCTPATVATWRVDVARRRREQHSVQFDRNGWYAGHTSGQQLLNGEGVVTELRHQRFHPGRSRAGHSALKSREKRLVLL